MLPAACVLAAMMTAGTGLALVEALDSWTGTGQAAAEPALATADGAVAGAQDLAASGNVSSFVNGRVADVVELKTGTEAVALTAAGAAASQVQEKAAAVENAAGDAQAFAGESGATTAAFVAMVAADAQTKAAAVESLATFVGGAPYETALGLVDMETGALLQATVLAQVVLSNADAVVADPTLTWTLVRAEAQQGMAHALGYGDLAADIAGDGYAVAQQFTALETGALSGVVEAAQDCPGSERPLGCAEDFAHAIIEA